MKTKGITIWEQYLERMVVAVAVLFLLGFGAWQFMRDPNVVESRGHTLRPSDADEALLKKAAEVAKKLDEQAPPLVEIPDGLPVLEEFRESLVASISPGGQVLPTEPRAAIVGYSAGAVVASDVPYVEPVIVAPQRVVAVQNFNGLEPGVMETHPSLKEDPGFAEAPYDLQWITVAATFDPASVRTSISTPGPNGERQLPPNWYADRVLDVKVVRQTDRSGTWTEETVLAPIPGQLSLRTELAGEVTKALSDDLLGRVAAPGAQRAIVQPDFFPLVGGTVVPPDPREIVEAAGPDGAAPQDIEYRNLKKKRDKLAKDRQRKVEELKELGGTLEPAGGQEPADPAGGARPGGEGGGGTGRPAPGAGGGKGSGDKGRAPPGMGGGGSGPGTTTSGEEGGKRRGPNVEIKIKNLKAKIAQLDTEIARLDERLKALRPDADIATDTAPDDGIGPDGFTGSEITIWAYDMTAKPGETYRYRLIVEVHNPFFARRMNLSEAQRHLADSLTLASEPSEWSAPLEVQPFTEIFVTSAHAPDPEHAERARGQLRMGQAQVEVWRFRNARWEDQQFGVEPGDRVGWIRDECARDEAEAPRQVDFSTDWFVLDIVGDIDADATTDREQGYAAIVWLQSLSDPAKRVRLSPREDVDSPRRQELRDQVETTEAKEELAQGE